jgi:molybdenum cofactor guanylyltransferase
VLAGGASRRMGQDKARLEVDGLPMALRVAAAMGPHCARVTLVRRVIDDWPLPVICDPPGVDRHPLWGVVAAMRHATSERIIVAPCDLPWLTETDIAAMVAGSAPCVATDGKRVHPLVGHFPVELANAMDSAARAGRSVRRVMRDYRQVTLPVDHLRNVNAPSDLPCKPSEQG